MTLTFKELFDANGLSRKKFCELTGISQATLTRMFRGDVHPGSAKRAAPVLGIDDWRMLLPRGIAMSDRWTTNPCEPLRGELMRYLREQRAARTTERVGKAADGRSTSTDRPRPLKDPATHEASPTAR